MTDLVITCNFCGVVTKKQVAPALESRIDEIIGSLLDQTGNYAWCLGCEGPRNVGKDYIYEACCDDETESEDDDQATLTYIESKEVTIEMG